MNSNDIFTTLLNYGTKLLVAILILVIGSKHKYINKVYIKNFVEKKLILHCAHLLYLLYDFIIYSYISCNCPNFSIQV